MIDWIAAHVGVPLLTALAAFFALLALMFWLMLAGVGFGLPQWVPFVGGAHVTLIDGAWEARDNAERAEKKAEDDRDGWKNAADAFHNGLNTCNASVQGLKATGDAATAKAQAAVAQLKAAQAALDAARQRLAAVPKSTDTCPSVDAIFTGAFQ